MADAASENRNAASDDVENPDEPDSGDDRIIGRAVLYSIAAVAGLALIVGGWFVVSRLLREPPPPPKPLIETTVRQTTIKRPSIPWTDVTESAGITFVHENGARGRKLLPESMGGGVAFFDYDADGDADLLFVGSTTWPDTQAEPHTGSSLALYRNDGTGQFEDVTEAAGLNATLYGMGCAVGDYDGDSDLDLYITAVGPNRLYRNDDGRFVDVTGQTGTAGGVEDWSTSAGFVDYDRDGDLDLIALNYLDWSIEKDASQDFRITGGKRAYGRPQNFGGTAPLLFRNDGDRFAEVAEVAEEAGLHVRNPNTGVPAMKSLGLGIDDLNGDGWPDLFIANDTVRNCLFLNDQDGTFTEEGITSGVAFDDMGNARGAMGVDIAQFRDDGSRGVVVGNFSNEMTALYVDQTGSDALFTDEAVASGLGPQTRLRLTFGVLFVDVDLDGRQDIVCANGHLDEDIALVQKSQTYAQPPQLFWNAGDDGETEFIPLGEQQLGDDFLKPMVGRGLATADIDLDGDPDLVITQVGGPPRLLRNDVDRPRDRSLIRFDDFPPGTLLQLEPTSGGVDRRVVTPTRGYLSQSEPAVTYSYAPGVTKNDAGSGDLRLHYLIDDRRGDWTHVGDPDAEPHQFDHVAQDVLEDGLIRVRYDASLSGLRFNGFQRDRVKE